MIAGLATKRLNQHWEHNFQNERESRNRDCWQKKQLE